MLSVMMDVLGSVVESLGEMPHLSVVIDFCDLLLKCGRCCECGW